VLRNPQPSDEEIAAGTRDAAGAGRDGVEPNALTRETAASFLRQIEASTGRAPRGTRLLEIGTASDAVRLEATARGYDVAQRTLSETAAAADGAFDLVILTGVLECGRDPLRDLLRLRRILTPGGGLFLTFNSRDSWPARMMRERWAGLKPEHLFYFDSATVQLLLFKAGFEQVALLPAAGAVNVIARRAAAPPPVERPQRLTVIMPVFNERATFSTIVAQLLAKTIPGVEIAVVIVESNSTDGTRDAVRAIEGHERVTVVYEERPRGKGHAVRTGLQHATGDYILIQDADLEYDLGDYDSLLEPLMTGRAAFVLGSRHGKDGASWKVRHFADQVAVSWYMNLGHVLFTALFNVTYGTRLRDPFTMFKVFRRDCLYGLTFEANRFDFDWELVGKLVRAGYRPLEIPVNYRSRSFTEGKKVSLLRDPLTWIRACFKFRFQPLGKKAR
jgi:SAM-dependent methyltransferase